MSRKEDSNVTRHTVHTLVFRSLKRTHDVFMSNQNFLPEVDAELIRFRKTIKAKEYSFVFDRVNKAKENKLISGNELTDPKELIDTLNTSLPINVGTKSGNDRINGTADRNMQASDISFDAIVPAASNNTQNPGNQNLMKKVPTMPKPKWHAPWKLARVIAGHLGWVRCISVDPSNEWFVTGAGDRVIKVWDLASGKLKLSLTGHVSTVRGVAVSDRHPYLFSCGEDRQVKCWDLEYNKVIRHYHGHLSAVYSLALHPTLDILATSGRDSTARIWDMRTKANVHTLTGHTNTVATVVAQATAPQIITGSHDSTIRLWDLAAGKSICTLTNHKKSVRSVVLHPILYMFASASPDNIKQWLCPEGKFIQNISGHNAIINCLAVNSDGVLVSGGDNGTMHFSDWRTGYNFQRFQAPVQPGSMSNEAGIFALCFDRSGSRLLTAEADKTIKIYKEDEEASEETHPVQWRPDILKRRKF